MDWIPGTLVLLAFFLLADGWLFTDDECVDFKFFGFEVICTSTTTTTSTSTTTTTTTTTSTSTLAVAATESIPCLDYTHFTEYEKRLHTYQLTGSDHPLSDDHLDDTRDLWYGLHGYTLWHSPPGRKQCGTYYPIWINGELPDTVGQSSDVEVCYQTSTENCTDPWTIPVRKCEGFHIFQLKRSPEPNTAYCLGAVDTGEVPTATVRPSVKYHLEDVRDDLTRIYFTCEFPEPQDGHLYYRTIYYLNENRIHYSSFEPWSSELFDVQRLNEDTLRSNDVTTLGFNIYCSVTISSSLDGPQTQPFTSDSEFMGVKIFQESVTVLGGMTTEISLHSTVALRCGDGSFVHDDACNFKIRVEAITDGAPGSCETRAMPSNCGLEVTKANWNNNQSLKITGEFTDGYCSADPCPAFQTTKFHLKTTGNQNMPIWRNYDIGELTVEVSGEKTIAHGVECYAVVDPHMLTFDRRAYEHQCEGDFQMYKHTVLPMEVQIRTRLCNDNSAYCVCAVAVRVSQTVFRLDYCHTPVSRSRQYFATLDDDRDLMRVEYYGNHFKIYLPTGTVVEAFETYPNFLNVHIYPSSSDISKTEGLCGNLNGDGSDDFKWKGETQSETDNGRACFREFSESWRVDDDDPGDMNLFYDDHITDLSRWIETEYQYCSCDSSEDTEGLSDSLTCSASSGRTCTVNGPQFRDLTRKAHNDLQKQPSNRPTFNCNGACSARKKRFANGWSETTARDYCNQLFENSTTFQLCEELGVPGGQKDLTLDICVLDIEITGSTEFSRAALEMYKNGCVRNVQLDSTLAAATTADGETFLSKIQAVTCPNDCNFNGRCVDGECVCNTNFEFPDCSIDVRAPPTTYGLQNGGHCSLNESTCDQTSMFLNYITDSAQATCRLLGFAINNRGESKDLTPTTTRPEVTFYGEALCNLPASPILYRDDLSYGYHVSVANDGLTYSDSHLQLVYDDTCVRCLIEDIVDCYLVKAACMENGRCYSEGAVNPNDSCLVCDIEDNTLSGEWSRSSDTTCMLTGSTATLTLSTPYAGLVLILTILAAMC